MKLKYTGLGHVKTFNKGDFTRQGVEDAQAVTFDQRNNWVAEVPDAQGQWLLDNAADAFREATEEDETVSDETRSGPAGRVKAPRSLGGSEDEGDGEGEEGPIEGVGAEAVGTTTGTSARARRSTRSGS